MGNVIIKIAGYIFLRYVSFLAVLYATDKSVKKTQWTDLQKGEDWFMFLWLFGLPVLLEFLIIGLPMGYGLNKMSNSNKVYIYVLFLVLFVLEFLFANWIYGTQSAFIKTGISIMLFLGLFWKRLF